MLLILYGAINTYHIGKPRTAEFNWDIKKNWPQLVEYTYKRNTAKHLGTVSAASIALIADAIVSITTPGSTIVTASSTHCSWY